jgi:snurportin-1
LCLSGQRCRLSTESKDKRACLFYKNGKKFLTLKSNIPAFTTLDCVYVAESRSVFILDVVSYDGRDVSGCDTSFRFFWIKSKFEEDNLHFDSSTAHHMNLVKTFDFSDSFAVQSIIGSCPVFKLGVKLDGYLFYHKEASYTPGESPLVLWLFPFMFEEIFRDYKVHEFYNSERPEGYTNYLNYIAEFNENAKKPKPKPKNKEVDSSMELEEEHTRDRSDEVQDEREAMMQLEMTGNDV